MENEYYGIYLDDGLANPSIEQTRRELFQHAVKRDWLESMICFQRKADGYADRDIDNAWWAFNAALDAVEIDLEPAIRTVGGGPIDGSMYTPEVYKAIESLNLGIKIRT